MEIVHADAEIPHGEYDIAFIDGAHEYEPVKRDIERCLDVLKPGGVLAFHDYNHPSHPGVKQAIDELLIDGGELLSVHESVAVVRPPARVLMEV